MAEVSITVGGRAYAVRCRDGEESHLHRLAAAVDTQIEVAKRSAPGLSEVRQLLFAALFLADELNDAKKAQASAPIAPVPAPPPPAADDGPAAAAMEALAARVEQLAERLAAGRSAS